MRISFEFETAGRNIAAIHFARLMLDIQHLCVMTVGLSSLDSHGEPYFPAFEAAPFFKYSRIIDLPDNYFAYATATIVRIKQESPLSLDLLIKLPKALLGLFKDNFVTIFNRFCYGDLERAKRTLELQQMREDILEKRIRNLESAFDLANKIPNARLRRQFVENLDSSIRPFLTEHPPIKAVEVREDDET